MKSPLPAELHEGAFQAGANLATRGQWVNEAIDRLNLNLAEIGCEPSVDAAFVLGSSQTKQLYRHLPVFTRAVRAATSSMIWRPESLVDIPPVGASLVESPVNQAHKLMVPIEDVDIEEVLDWSTEGAVWIDPEAEQSREDIAKYNGMILRRFLGGLASQGYAKRRGKRDMRQEFCEILDSFAMRTSYRSYGERKVVIKMMGYAGLRTPKSRARAVTRTSRGLLANFDIGT